MKIGHLGFVIATVSCLSVASMGFAQQEAGESSANKSDSGESRPNILLIVGDDIGYADFGFMGSEISTPVLDKFASESSVFLNFHVAPTCSVTRAMLLTGVDSHLIGLGAFDYTVYPPLMNHAGYETYMTKNVVTVATVLKDAGYDTFATGKWHLGHKEGHLPYDRGFNEDFMLLAGGANHFSNLGMLPKEPTVTWTSQGKIVPRGTDVYSDDLYNGKLLEMFKKNKDSGKPFFAYLAYQSAHFPLQNPDDTWKKYFEHYQQGWALIQKERFTSMINAGIIPNEATIPNYSKYMIETWETMDEKQIKYWAKRFALYAAMIEIQDRHIGEIFDYLKKNGLYDNTIIMYLPDNGPEAVLVSGKGANPSVSKWVSDNYDNSFENLGKESSNTTIGPFWARTSATPLWLFKGYTSEGGIRVPLIVKDLKNTRKGSRTYSLADVKDITATILDYAGVEHPGGWYKGKSILPMSGLSMKPYLEGERKNIHPDDEPIGRALFGNPAILMGDYKLLKIRSAMPGGDGEFHLYNIRVDPGETTDLREKLPDLYNKMHSAWINYELTSNVQPIADDWKPLNELK